MIRAAKYQSPPTATMNVGVEKLIVYLTKKLEDWDKKTDVLVTHYKKEKDLQLYLQQDLIKYDAEDPAVLLAPRVYVANAGVLDQLVYSI